MHADATISIRWPNEDTGGYFSVPALLLNESTALALFDQCIEIHIVEATDQAGIYHLRYASHPIFYVHNRGLTALQDASRLTLVEFASQYKHADFWEVHMMQDQKRIDKA